MTDFSSKERIIPCYCINRECKSVRKQNMISIFKQLNIVNLKDEKNENKVKLDLIFSDTVADKDNLPEDMSDIVANQKMTSGAIACSISHFNLWNFSEDTKVIHEDDIYIRSDYNGILAMYLDILATDQNWDVVLLSRNCFGQDVAKCFIEKENCLKNQKVAQFFMVPEKLGYGGHTYIVHKRAVKKIANLIYPLTDINDELWNKWHNAGILNFYVARQNVSYPVDINDSDTN